MSPLSESVYSQRLPAGAVRLSSGSIEALKWLGLLFMLLDHTNSYLLAHRWEWMYNAGRIAFPLFAVALGAALSSDLHAKASRLAFHLLPFAVLAQVGSQLVREFTILNVLFLFIAAGAWIGADSEPAPRRYLVRTLCVVTGTLSEFTLPGLFFCVWLWRFQSTRHPMDAFAAAAALVLVGLLDGTLSAFFALFIVALVMLTGPHVPRIKNLFAWLYVLQFPVFLGSRWLYG